MSNSSTPVPEKSPLGEVSVSGIQPAFTQNGETQSTTPNKPTPNIISPTPQHTLVEQDKSESVPPPKQSISQKLRSKLPTYNQFKKTLKADIALTVVLILVLDRTTNIGIGQGTLLTCISMIFFCPVKPIGLQVEVVTLSLLGVMVTAAWSFLGMYLANLSRDHTKANPLQASSGVILEIFLFIGTFFLNWVRSNYPKANFAGILGCIVLIFAMTTAAIVPTFSPTVIWTFVIPICIGAGFALLIDIVIWPEDTANDCLTMFATTLESFNQLLTKQVEVFLQDPYSELPGQATPLSVIHGQLQGNIMMLIESKRAVQREVLYSRLTAKDFSYLTKLVKSMRIPLHGIGLSRVIEQEMYDAQSGGVLQKWQTVNLTSNPVLEDFSSIHSDSQSEATTDTAQLIQEYHEILNVIRPICNNLAVECKTAVTECMTRLNGLHNRRDKGKPETSPQLPNLAEQPKDEGLSTSNATSVAFAARLRMAIENFEKDRISGMDRLFSSKLTERDPHRAMLLLLLFQYNLREYADKVLEMADFITKLEKERQKRHIGWPNITLKKWLKGDTRDEDITANGNQISDGDGTAQLARTASRVNYQQAALDSSAGPFIYEEDAKGRVLRRDPDVLAPATKWERFWYRLYEFKVWLLEPETLTVLKTSIGCILLALPAYFTSSAVWYNEWRGQWAVITLVFWMFPSSGLLIFGFFLRLLGTIIGSVLGIVVWEICQGVTYALAVVMFILNYILYHIFFYKPFWRVCTLMTQITLILVVAYRYNYVLQNNAEPVWEVAGKRCLLVVIGVVAASIMYCIPFPVTGRVELRYRLAQTVRDIGTLYSALIYSFENVDANSHLDEQQRKKFAKLALSIQRQIALERTLLAHAKYEPPLRGKYPQEKYAKLLDTVDNMADMVYAMGASLEKLPPFLREDLSRKAKEARKTYIATVMTGFKLVSAALAAKTSLPPYLHYPKDALREFGEKIRQVPNTDSSYFKDPGYTVFAAYFLNSGSFVMELQKLLEIMEDLVGIDTPIC
ncbi:hypothetical protein BC943DRAFT_355200 [Umbelopsis sp. AD052]|nr:hypothetical protein BC943DRAFT_355200 [Umbelopsis sp. AD052]